MNVQRVHVDFCDNFYHIQTAVYNSYGVRERISEIIKFLGLLPTLDVQKWSVCYKTNQQNIYQLIVQINSLYEMCSQLQKEVDHKYIIQIHTIHTISILIYRGRIRKYSVVFIVKVTFANFYDTSFNKAILLLMGACNNLFINFIQTHYFQDTDFLPYLSKACCYFLSQKVFVLCSFN